MKQSKQECARTQAAVQLGDSPAEDLLSESLERLFRKWLSEDVSELFLGVNLLDLNVFREMRPEPVDLDITELGPGSGLSRVQVGWGFSRSVVFPTCHFESEQVFIWDSNCFGHSHGQVPQGQHPPPTAVDKARCSAIIVLSAMESWSLEDQTIGQ